MAELMQVQNANQPQSSNGNFRSIRGGRNIPSLDELQGSLPDHPQVSIQQSLSVQDLHFYPDTCFPDIHIHTWALSEYLGDMLGTLMEFFVMAM